MIFPYQHTDYTLIPQVTVGILRRAGYNVTEENTTMSRVLTIAHRGYSAAAPENTLAAFRKAVELKPDFMECDVRQTKDGELIVIHDATLDRTTNGSGKVADMTFDELRKLDAGSWFAPEFSDEKLPTLDEVIEVAKDTGVKLIVEIKEPGTEDEVVAALYEHGMQEQSMLCSFHYKVGVRMPELAPEIPFSPIIAPKDPVGEDEAVALADEAAAVNGSIFAVYYKAISPALVKATHTANMLMEAWTVDDEAEMRRLADMGVDVIGSNDVRLAIEALSGDRPLTADR